jgi:ribonucleoside-diphosphate reductase alpha chain
MAGDDLALGGPSDFGSGRADPLRTRLPDERSSITHHATIHAAREVRPGETEAYQTDLYLVVGFYDDGRPGELQAWVGKAGTKEAVLVDAWCKAVTIGLQHGIPLQVYVDAARGLGYEPAGFTSNQDVPMARSILDYIAKWLEARVCGSMGA